MWSMEETVRLTPAELVARVRRSIGFRLTRYVNDRRYDRFRRVPCGQYLRQYSNEALPGVHVYSFCGAGGLYQQILSILSFLRHAGIPETWTIASDGSLTADMGETLRRLHPVIQIVPWTSFITDQNQAGVKWYSRSSPLGKKLALVSALPERQTSVYIDSDVLFFPGAVHLRELLKAPEDNFCMKDWAQNFPQGLVTEAEAKLPSVNTGFLIQAKPVVWDEPLDRLARLLREHPEWETALQANWLVEQTLVHIAYHACGVRILDEKLYILESSDAWQLRDRFARPDRVLRHYLGFSRPKLWAEAKHYYRSRPQESL